MSSTSQPPVGERDPSSQDGYPLLAADGVVVGSGGCGGRGLPPGMAIRFRDLDEKSARLIRHITGQRERDGLTVFVLPQDDLLAEESRPPGERTALPEDDPWPVEPGRQMPEASPAAVTATGSGSGEVFLPKAPAPVPPTEPNRVLPIPPRPPTLEASRPGTPITVYDQVSYAPMDQPAELPGRPRRVMAPALIVGVVAALILALWVFVALQQGRGSSAPLPRNEGASASSTPVVTASSLNAAVPTAGEPQGLIRPEAVATARPTVSPSPVPSPALAGVPASRITDVAWDRQPDGTVVTVTADGMLASRRVREFMMTNPPRLVVRIAGIGEGFTPYRVSVRTPELNSIRIGLHEERTPPELHLVFDLAPLAGAPPEVTASGGTVTVFVPAKR